LVIGGAGYIGSHVVELLLQKGHRVRVLDRLLYGSALAEFANHARFELFEGDAANASDLETAIRGIRSVVHLAGLSGDTACAVDEAYSRHANIAVTRMVKQAAQSMGVTRLVFASSCSVYGTSAFPVSESEQLRPLSLYARTKIDSELELLKDVPDNCCVTILRFATVFGHSRRARFDLVANLFVAQAMADGLIAVIGPNQWRPFIHVRDVARAVESALVANPAAIRSQIFNVGDERLNMTILQMAERVRSIAGEYHNVNLTIRDNPEDARDYAVSFKKIKQTLGFQANTAADSGIREMVGHFRAGAYADYRQERYSNVAMTRKALSVR
jgi:nucleoside-diphosphate-sugar epimerase